MLQIEGLAPESFDEEQEAVARAIPIIKDQAISKALNAGAVLPQVSVHEKIDASVRRIKARAVGNPDLSRAKYTKEMDN